ncbi:MAG: ABC transporter permease, partial [Actinomycetota bacterium]
QVRRDRRTLALMIVMPVVLLVVFGYAASFDVSNIPVVVYGPDADAGADRLPAVFTVEEVDSDAGDDQGVERLRSGESVVAIIAEPTAPRALIDGSQLFSARAALQVLTEIQRQLPNLEVEVLFNPELDTSAVLVPGLGGLILLFIGTVITSLGVVRERQAGTLEQLAVMPLRPTDVFVGKVAPYFLVASLDLILVLGVGTALFGVPFNGNPLILALGSVLFLFVTLGLGVLISGVSQNQGQAIQLALMALLPQVLLSGIIFPLESMAPGVRWIGYLLPLTYFNRIARGVMVRGAPIESLLGSLALLALLGSVVFGLAVVRFRRDLAGAKTGGRHHAVAAS